MTHKMVMKFMMGLVLMGVSLLSGPSSALASRLPQLEFLAGAMGDGSLSDYTSTLSRFGFAHSADSVDMNGAYRATLAWPVGEYVDVLLSTGKVEGRDYGQFQWDVYGLSGGVRGRLPLGTTGEVYVEGGLGPSWTHTVLKNSAGSSFVENHIGKMLRLGTGFTVFLSDSLGLTGAVSRSHAWAMKNRFDEEHTTANWNALMGITIRMGASKS